MATKRRRDSAKNTLKRYMDACAQLSFSNTRENIETYSELLQTQWQKFIEAQDDIEAACDDEKLAEEYDVRIQAEAFYTGTLTCLKRLQNKLPPTPDSVHKVRNIASVQLPKLEIPQFQGEPTEWPSFHDAFSHLVHKNEDLSSAQKMHYLRSCLKGEALQLIINFKICDSSYDEAWGMLVTRYQVLRVIVDHHLKAICTVKPADHDTASSIKQVLDVIQQHVRGLHALNRPVQFWDDWLVHLVVSKLAYETRKQWELSLTSNDLPNFETLNTFLETRCRSLGMLTSHQPATQNANKKSNNVRNSATALHAASKQDGTQQGSFKASICWFCNSEHKIYTCTKFIALSTTARMDAAKQKGSCFNCLSEGHRSINCQSKSSCRVCHQRHHTLLHNAKTPQSSSEPKASTSQQGAITGTEATIPATTSMLSANQTSSHFGSTRKIVLLGTANANAIDNSGRKQNVRILLDNGSQASFISEACIQRLELQRRSSSTCINGIGASIGTHARGKTTLKLSSLILDETISIDVFILSKITNDQPPMSFTPPVWEHIQGLSLADPKFYQSGPVDILVGADALHMLLLPEIRMGPSNSPIAQSTVFGWVLLGRAFTTEINVDIAYNMHCDVQLEDTIARLWEIENPPAKRHFTPDELRCEELFDKTHRRSTDGRFIVQLPLKDNIPLVNNRNMAIRSLLRMEKRFSENENLRIRYAEFMKEFLDLKHMEPVNDQPENCYYMPHHAVLKNSSSTTKLRVVFNASAKTATGYSLNDALSVGPQLQQELFSILLRFRSHRYAMTADVQKMYRQVYIAPEHTDLQRIVWREHPNAPIQDFRMLRVTYGVAAASHLAVKSMQQTALNADQAHQAAAQIILRDFYMDDLLTGSDNENSLCILQNQIATVLQTGGFDLRKWASNSKFLTQTLPEVSRDMSHYLVDGQEVRTLGLIWNADEDSLTFSVNLKDPPPIFTKRTFLSDVSTLFDPLGLLTPCTIKSKLLFQQLWRTDTGWDDAVPNTIIKDWLNLRRTITNFSTFKINRWLGTSSNDNRIELHVFADASERGYAAVMHSRIITASGEITTNIVAARAKVAPLKTTTLPRLELCAAHLGAKLVRQVQTSLQHLSYTLHAWTDSTITLAWLQSHPNKWSTFVANRVADIQEVLPSNCWSHVRSKENPADCASRSVTPVELMNLEIWWKGPPWLREKTIKCPKSNAVQHLTRLEMRRTVLSTAIAETAEIWDLLTRFSSYSKLTRVTAFILRFLKLLQRKPVSKTRIASCKEIQEAEIVLFRYIQSFHFNKEIFLLRMGRPISLRSALIRLQPFLDEKGLLRVGGRIKRSELSLDVKHPIVLPKGTHFAEIIAREIHKFNLHAGPQMMLSTLRRRFWVIGARNLVRKVYRNCLKCMQLNQTMISQQMGDLPSSRVTYTRPFFRTAVDYAGPYPFKFSSGRGVKSTKGYICSFICMSTGAMHLEFAVDLSTPAFLNAFKRFVNRRGFCREMYSDNGTNFVGAEKQLRQMFLKCLQDPVLCSYFADLRINWHFNPPNAPHMGGYWEVGIKRIKYHLKRSIGETLLTFEEYATLLTEIEACVNSRPLCSSSNDVNDLEVLTPGHFILGEPLRSLPETDGEEFRGSLQQRWQTISSIRRHFWNRWHNEYLVNLQLRNKWCRSKPNLKEGDIVAVSHEGCPPTQWKIARVLKCHTGIDGLVRVVTLKTSSGEIVRPITKLCVLNAD